MFQLRGLVFISVLSLFTIALADQIKQINIKGNYAVEDSTIEEYLGIKLGTEYSESIKDKAIKNLYATSLFQDIKIDFSEKTLHIKVNEALFIRSIQFKGNYKIKAENLSDIINTIPGTRFQNSIMLNDAQTIKEAYKTIGRFAVKVKTEIQKEESNKVKILFHIDEGPKTPVRAIYFTGNKVYSDEKLRKMILTKKAHLFSFLSKDDSYNPAKIEHDKKILDDFYKSVGFADFRVASVTAEFLKTMNGFTITYAINEGKKYNFGEINIENKLKALLDSEIEGIAKLSEFDSKDATFSPGKIERISQRIKSYLTRQGFHQVNIRYDALLNRDAGLVDVNIIIESGSALMINKINITGNLKTKDRVIRNRLKMEEGEFFDRKKVDRSVRSIYRLGFFKDIKPHFNMVDDGLYNIDLDVHEKPSGSLALNGGYDTSDSKIFGLISLSEPNLVGSGIFMALNANFRKNNHLYSLFLADPQFMDSNITVKGKIFKQFKTQDKEKEEFSDLSKNEDKDHDSVEKKDMLETDSIGGSISIGYNVSDDLFHEISYYGRRDKNDLPKDNPSKKKSLALLDLVPESNKSAISHSLEYDMLDNPASPKSGYVTSILQEFAGVGGDVKYLKHNISAKWFTSFSNNQLTLKLHGLFGDIRGLQGKKVPLSECFSLGDNTMRGFASSGIGPRDKLTNDFLGAKKYYKLSSELRFPVKPAKDLHMTGLLFIDVGGLWDPDVKSTAKAEDFYDTASPRISAGIGVEVMTPFAPIGITFGVALKKEEYDKTQSIHFRFSTDF